MTKTKDKIKEVIALAGAIEEFSMAMMEKLSRKNTSGCLGWDNPSLESEIRASLRSHVDRLLGGESQQETDIANLVMMLWWQREHKGK